MRIVYDATKNYLKLPLGLYIKLYISNNIIQILSNVPELNGLVYKDKNTIFDEISALIFSKFGSMTCTYEIDDKTYTYINNGSIGMS